MLLKLWDLPFLHCQACVGKVLYRLFRVKSNSHKIQVLLISWFSIYRCHEISISQKTISYQTSIQDKYLVSVSHRSKSGKTWIEWKIKKLGIVWKNCIELSENFESSRKNILTTTTRSFFSILPSRKFSRFPISIWSKESDWPKLITCSLFNILWFNDGLIDLT